MTLQHQQTSGSSILFLIFVYVFMHIQASVRCCFVWHKDLNLRRGKECFRHQCLNLLCVLLFVYLKYFNFLGSGCQVCTFSSQGQCTWIGRHPVGPWSLGGICPSVCLSIFLSVGGGRGGLMPFQSEKRLAKDLRRLRMVSAFTSSWLRLARGAGVSGMLKVLVRDWDLL